MSKSKRFQKLRIPDETFGGIYDSETDKILNINDIEHKLNKQQDTIGKYARINEQAKIYADGLQFTIQKIEKENKKLRNQLDKIPPKIKEVWLE